MGRTSRKHCLTPARPEKALSDHTKLSEGGRFILTIGESGRYTLHENDDFAANVFAVFAPAYIDGIHVEQALILEVGIGRGAPYAHTFRKGADGKCLSVDRKKVRDATETEQKIIWEVLTGLMRRLTEKQIAGRKRAELWFQTTEGGESYAYTRGKRFLVSLDDHWIRNILLETEFLHRWKWYLHKRSRAIWFWLKEYRYTDYPKRQSSGFVGLRKTAELLSGIRFRHRFIRWRFLQALGPKQGLLVRNTMEHFGLSLDESSYMIPSVKPRLDGYHIFIHNVDENRGTIGFEHAPDEKTLEVLLGISHGEPGDLDADHIPFTTDELTKHDARVGKPSDSDDIPF